MDVEWTASELQDCLNKALGEQLNYQRLLSLKDKGWNNPDVDDVFRRRREAADGAGEHMRKGFFGMLIKIAEQIDGPAHLLRVPYRGRVLDLCAAPGSFLKYILGDRRDLSADAISLPVEQGGHPMLLNISPNDSSINLRYADLTMFAAEIGCTDVPIDHLEYDELQQIWPFQGDYDLILCNGQTLRRHAVPEYRQGSEQSRLFVAQLSIALHRVREGGTIVMLMTQVGKYMTFSTIYRLAQFSEVTLIKPKPFHAIKSSFFMVARRIKRGAQLEALMVETRRMWRVNTPGDVRIDDLARRPEPASKAEFGNFIDEYKRLAREVIDVQAEALERAHWTRDKQNGNE